MTDLLEIGLEGFLLQGSLILALGAQNIFVLESGLRRQRHLLVATVCFLCDLALILFGVLGAAAVFIQLPILKFIFGFLGCAFLLYYGVLKLREAAFPKAQPLAVEMSPSLKQTLLATLAFSLLNPHVYLDTVILIGGYSSRFAAVSDRLSFGMGAAAFSGLWFYGLALLASLFHRLIHNPNAMRVISLLSGIILTALCFRLGLDLVKWAHF